MERLVGEVDVSFLGAAEPLGDIEPGLFACSVGVTEMFVDEHKDISMQKEEEPL
jgi:hypothetical protein